MKPTPIGDNQEPEGFVDDEATHYRWNLLEPVVEPTIRPGFQAGRSGAKPVVRRIERVPDLVEESPVGAKMGALGIVVGVAALVTGLIAIVVGNLGLGLVAGLILVAAAVIARIGYRRYQTEVESDS